MYDTPALVHRPRVLHLVRHLCGALSFSCRLAQPSLPLHGAQQSPTRSTRGPSPSRAKYAADPSRRRVWAPLLVLAVVAAGAVALAVAAARYLRRPAASTRPRCHGYTCRRYEELLANAMDPEAPPCDNFYAHVCGTWVKAGRRPVYEVNWNRFLVQIAKRTADFSPRTGSDQEPVDKAVAYTSACLSPLEQDNMLEVRAVLAAAGVTWPRPDPKPDFLSVMFHMSRRVYQPVFIAVDVDTVERPRTLMFLFGVQIRESLQVVYVEGAGPGFFRNETFTVACACVANRTQRATPGHLRPVGDVMG